MKNQYFGDVKDYLTYGLLRSLAQASGLRIGIGWMLTPDTPDGKGELRAYLGRPDLWRQYDPALFDALARVPEHGRNVSFIERFDLIPEACCFSELVPQGAAERDAYFQRLWAALHGCPLLFLDPDNGLETRSARRGAQRSTQHVYWDEIEEAYYRRGHSLLVFQHFPRRSRAAYLAEQAGEYAAHLGVHQVAWFETAQVAFFLIARPEHQDALKSAVGAVSARWGERIRTGEWGTETAVSEEPWRLKSRPGLQSPPSRAETSSARGGGLRSPNRDFSRQGLKLTLLDDRLAVCRLPPDAPTPPWATGELTAITRTAHELSIVCADERVPPGVRAERGWRALMVAGPLDFGLTGILAALAAPLAEAGISIFALSTYDTDYLLVKEEKLAQALEVLRLAGHHLQTRP